MFWWTQSEKQNDKREVTWYSCHKRTILLTRPKNDCAIVTLCRKRLYLPRQAVPETSHRTQAPGGLSKKTTSCLQPCTCEADKKASAGWNRFPPSSLKRFSFDVTASKAATEAFKHVSPKRLALFPPPCPIFLLLLVTEACTQKNRAV